MNDHPASYFRKHARADHGSNWRLVPWILLGIFDLYMIGRIAVLCWQIWGPR